LRLPNLTLVIGGAASGKSAFAERLVHQSGLAKTYIATAEAFDDEMQAKIDRHKADRAGQGWHTIEAPRQIAKPLAALDPEEVALVDCVTLWLNNLMMAEAGWQQELQALQDSFHKIAAPVVLVTNDLSGGIIPENALARRFQRLQGHVNQVLARQANLVVQVTAGLPLVLKGPDLPDDLFDHDDLWP